MKLNKLFTLFVLVTFVSIISFDNAYAEESQTIHVEIKYTNGDRVDYDGMKLIVYQDFSKDIFLEKQLEGNPDFITVPENHRYKIEVYANGMYADVGYIQLNDKPEKLNINIPLSGGLQFQIFYKNGQIPIDKATVVLKSHDNSEWGRGITNDQGKTLRYWVQSTIKQGDYYIADIYLEDLFLTSFSPIKIQPGLAIDQKIIINIPEIVEELISINLYVGSKKITSTDGIYKVTLMDLNENYVVASDVNFRGDAQFSNLKSGTYTVKITSNSEFENKLWPHGNIHIIGDLNKFNIFRNSEVINIQENSFQSCNCISFRLDDIQDYWLADTQIEIINLFAEKNIPLTVGVIGGSIGSDDKIVSILKKNIEKKNIEIANHSWNNDVVTNMDIEMQKKYIVDTNKKIFEILGVNPTTFIPPENLYNEQTVKILKENKFTHLSSHIEEQRESNIEDNFYYVPAITETGVLEKDKNQWKIQEKEFIREKNCS